jgi:hypothetical protein
MIDNKKTKTLFGYDVEFLSPSSHNKVVHLCDQCGKERTVEYRRAVNKKKYLCHDCLMTGTNNYFSTHKYEKSLNAGYLDGRTKKQHFCKHPECNRKINVSTFWGTGFCKRHAQLGKLNGRYIDGRTPIQNLIRNLPEGKQWSYKIFKRDNFKCTKCGKQDSGRLSSHHLKHFSKILTEFLNFYSQFSPMEDKETLVRLSLNWPEFWDINNGISLCEECHNDIHSNV